MSFEVGLGIQQIIRLRSLGAIIGANLMGSITIAMADDQWLTINGSECNGNNCNGRECNDSECLAIAIVGE
ncbi:MAG: hypothetical protein EA001_07425 [Oscillatoriales cyanobacterium]|nr:MAG: hypothetical protein EA001_07425 [Oscillatoriales cyanobacterium]